MNAGTGGASASTAGSGGISASTAGSGGINAGASGAGGSAGAADGAGASGSDGVRELPTGLTPPDPSVSFEWNATLPGGDDDCRPGHYTGTFSCDYFAMPTDTVPQVTVTGPISLTLERSQNGEFLEIADGQLEGIAQLIIGFRAQLSGTLDCSTRKLTANAVDGVYGFGDPAIFPFGMFEGTLDGELSGATGTLDGTWDLGIPNAGSCIGPWQANWAP